MMMLTAIHRSILLAPNPAPNPNSVDRFSKNDIIVSPSILSADFSRLGDEVRERERDEKKERERGTREGGLSTPGSPPWGA